MTRLREELDRIAGSAPTVEVPADLWDRVRRSRLRDRALVVAAGVAVVALVAGLVAWARTDHSDGCHSAADDSP